MQKQESDAIQDTLFQTVVPWHIEYFKLKEFEKTTDLLPSHLSSLEQVIYPLGIRSILTSEDKGISKKIPNK